MNLCKSLIYIFTFLFTLVQCHNNNKQLLWVEPITSVSVDIAPRTDSFFLKRDLSANLYYQPTARSLQYDDSLRLTMSAFNKTVYLHLTPNYELFHPDAVIHQQGRSIKLNPMDYRVYRGYVIEPIYSEHYWMSGQLDEHQPGVLGWARITVRNDIGHDLFEGAFSVYGDIHHVKLADNYRLTKRADDAELRQEAHMIVYRDSDTMDKEESGSCGFDRMKQPAVLKREYNPFEITDMTYNLGKTQLSKRAPPQGCPTSKKILYMGAAADCTYIKQYQSTDNARMQIINNWNSVSNVYASSFNVALGLINITMMESACPTTPVAATNWNQVCSTSYGISTRLSDFSKWRGNIGDDGAGLWHLMTNCATGPEVGIAWLGQVCNTGAIRSSSTGEYTSGTGVSSIIRDEWKVVAHEIGHGFGAIHDCMSQNCPCSGSSCQCCPFSSTQCDAGGQYFMNPTSNATSDSFSPCSITTICTAMPNFLTCLQDPGTRNITTLGMCGNGIKETGEDCDTGGQASDCCNPSTCKFKTGAVCDDFNDLCCNSCQLRPANYTCRAASTECDVAEVCSGTSGDCPPDKYKDDLTSCSNGLQCASGQCTSRNTQCAARGATSNIKTACGGDNGCQVSCQNPSSAMSCIVFPGSFVDGTPCGIGGVCKSGSCDSSNVGNNALNWINNNKQIVIPVAIVVGLLLLFCLFRCCCYGDRTGYNNISKTTVYTVPGGQYANTQQPYYPPPPTNQPYYQPPPQQPHGWVDPAQYNGAGFGQNPQQPLPVYSQNDASHHASDSYELNNYNTPHSPAPPYPTPPPHGGRPYHEGVI